ncbi:fimbrial protein [Serratia fonticola]
MFKKTLLFLALTTAAGSAVAAPVANLKVTGSITPPTCTVNGVDEADVLYTFDVSPGMFPASGNLSMEAQSQNIQVVCDATTYLAFNATDERAGTELTTGNTNFGLGLYGDDTKVGFYKVTMKNATVKADENATDKSVGVRVGNTYGTSGVVDKTQTVAWATDINTLAAGQVFAADFSVVPTLNAAMKNSDGTAQLDGHAVLTFAFGV